MMKKVLKVEGSVAKSMKKVIVDDIKKNNLSFTNERLMSFVLYLEK